MIKSLILMVLIFTFFGCKFENEKYQEIKRLSKVSIPAGSSLLIYYDNLEFDVAFKMAIERNKVTPFLKTYHFEKVDTLKTNSFAKTSTDKYILDDIENSFPKREKIFGGDLHIFKNRYCTLIVNRETSELWGIINY